MSAQRVTRQHVRAAVLRLVTQRQLVVSGDTAAPARPGARAWAHAQAVIRTGDNAILPYRDIARDYQDEILSDPARRIIIAKSRQIGVSQTAAFIAAEEALAGGSVLVISRNSEQASEFLKYVYTALSQCPHPPFSREGLGSFEFQGGGRVVTQAATPGAGRGIVATLVIMDEMAWMQHARQIYTAVTPTLATTGGRLIVLSSANGQNNLFYELWQAAQANESPWAVYYLPWHVHPDWAAVPNWPELKRDEDSLTAEQFAQEYAVDFLLSGQARFAAEDIAALWRGPSWATLIDSPGHYEAHNPPQPGHSYVTAYDIARRQDAFVGITFDVSVAPFVVAAFSWRTQLPYPAQAAHIAARHRLFLGLTEDATGAWQPAPAFRKQPSRHVTLVESNGVGDPLIEFLAVPVTPFATLPLSKRNALDALQLLLQRHELISPHVPVWARELTLYQDDDKALAQDTVMAAAIAALKAGRPVRPRLPVATSGYAYARA